jgi:hypothetical protein
MNIQLHDILSVINRMPDSDKIISDAIDLIRNTKFISQREQEEIETIIETGIRYGIWNRKKRNHNS